MDRPLRLQEVEVPKFQDSRHTKVVTLSALCTGHIYTPVNIPGTHFCKRLNQPQGSSTAGRIMSMKNSNDTIRNRTRDLPDCSAQPQPTAPPAAFLLFYNNYEEKILFSITFRPAESEGQPGDAPPPVEQHRSSSIT